jgi:predicted nucleic acid-binding Zn ribbon protein
MRRHSPRPISAALSHLGDRLAPQSTLASAQAGWERAVGGQIAAHCRPVFERSGTLTVDCESAVWAAELQMQGPEILAALNGALGPGSALAALRFRVR